MGSGSSKPVETSQVTKSGTGASVNSRADSQPTPPPPVNLADVADDSAVASKSNSSAGSSSESKCPMHRADGTYSYDWRALFQSSFPHGPGGKKPLTEEEARANITRRLSCMDATMASPGIGCPIKEQETIQVPTSIISSNSGGGGCPVKAGRQQQQEYNVYAQPIDSKNNMPQEANQLPAPGQTKPLSTDRVKSNIPKVRHDIAAFLVYISYDSWGCLAGAHYQRSPFSYCFLCFHHCRLLAGWK
jgi:Cytochrome c/c1 heme lyase